MSIAHKNARIFLKIGLGARKEFIVIDCYALIYITKILDYEY